MSMKNILYCLQITVLKENWGLKSLNWPGNSPDLNPIENLWGIMKQKLRGKKACNIEELKKVICNVWENDVTQEMIDNLYESLPKRVLAVIKNKGDSTKY
jgi:transposase